ncbi:PSME3-interacting protein [Topomyia yanbarensis]|uniref:PSME3-interacting protein n=1 Tax=Topomyia yanbarensis TaxID=2498891 RepID=UPI00273AA5D7|nr:PSME3-interacting protein [Topomyia yanbarensis]XP_058838666.1 PSME3-interacting protein [Topomyia yanbarensis]
MSSGFVTESELAEARQKRQEEWEKVRTADQPLEAPEEEYDGRSLYDRLQEQKQKKDFEFEEAHKLKNMIKTLDDDEVEFLDLVDKNKLKAERQAQIDEAKEMSEFRQKVASLQEQRMDEKIQQQISKGKPAKSPLVSNRLSQKKILAGVVVKKRKFEDDPPNVSNIASSSDQKIEANVIGETKNNPPEESTAAQINENTASKKLKTGAMQVIGILPGLGSYRESTDSEASSDSDDEAGQYDWIGRKLVKEKEECK